MSRTFIGAGISQWGRRIAICGLFKRPEKFDPNRRSVLADQGCDFVPQAADSTQTDRRCPGEYARRPCLWSKPWTMTFHSFDSLHKCRRDR
jgi:hypothetical protein